ncbi:MAG TPA: HD domain-containing protein [Pseudobdellovibrionaceae bacterium]|nr:HD domain-containing protein [Pseudobdellovibrionaceae bacterium]
MEIRDPVHGSMYFSDNEVQILDTVEFQRLRAIKQLGFSEFSFPGATHNRYLHSLGVSHLSGIAFDSIFKITPFSKASKKSNLRSALRLAALLHDVGHGPLSHTTEQVMPYLNKLSVKILQEQNLENTRRANHEDYTLKYITESAIADTLKKSFSDLLPIHVACLLDKSLTCPDDFFIDQGLDYRPILSQIVSSELDVDRMDYLERDSYFCGTNYGRIDHHWLLQSMAYQVIDTKVYLALNRRALYSFDDFLLSRHHMHLMVYCHHKSIIYEEMLNNYLTSPDCDFILPFDINDYTQYNDYRLHEHLSQSHNPWAQRIAQRKPFKVILEQHRNSTENKANLIFEELRENHFNVINTSTEARLSKYHSLPLDEGSMKIFVIDQYNPWDLPAPISQSTEIFQRYEVSRVIDRIYIDPEQYDKAERLIKTMG